MRVLVYLNKIRDGYKICLTNGREITHMDRFNLVNAYCTKRQGKIVLIGTYMPYNEDIDNCRNITTLDNIAFDNVIFTLDGIYGKVTSEKILYSEGKATRRSTTNGLH
jgi:hypothetical protein